MGRRRDVSCIESLEPRRLMADVAAALANVPFPNIDVSRRVGNESEPTVAVDRTDPNHVFVASNTDVGRAGVFVAYSTDAGATWNGRLIGDGNDDLPSACCDSSAAFDAFGNLFLTYINSDKRHVEVLSSTDGGKSFDLLTSFRGDVDQPTLTTGPGSGGSPQSLWLTYDEGDGVVAVGAPVSGRGQVGDFGDVQDVPGSTGGAFGDVAVGHHLPARAVGQIVRRPERRPRRPRAGGVRQAGHCRPDEGRPVRRRAAAAGPGDRRRGGAGVRPQ